MEDEGAERAERAKGDEGDVQKYFQIECCKQVFRSIFKLRGLR